MKPSDIVAAAVNVRTFADATALQRLIVEQLGSEHKRPLGDRWNNFGLISAGGSYDHKLIENVTNMQDAVIELEAANRFGGLSSVPYRTPREAAHALLGELDWRSVADRASVAFHESDSPTNESRRLTVVFRDTGCGLTPEQIPETIFHLGSPHKDSHPWLQGAFGLGGATTFRNARAVVLVSRRVPQLLRPEQEDRIAVAVLMWENHDKGKGAYYLVVSPLEGGTDGGIPFWTSATNHPGFAPGTQLSLVSYGVEGYHRRRLGDDRSFDTVLNTRLFEPITPVRFTHYTRDRNEYLRGLGRRLDDGDDESPKFASSAEVLPYNAEGATYHLPIKYHVFGKPREAGERRNYVAHDHAVVFTSNGQVHYHWTPQQFKLKTNFTKLYSRIFVVVETDDLPIQFRTALFTADRSELVRSDPAIRLEDAVAGFLSDWSELREANGQLIREALAGEQSGGATLGVANQISRALQVKGFSVNGKGASGGGARGGGGPPQPPIDLYDDPTTLEGPARVTAQVGKTKFVNYTINAVDGFIPRRALLSVVCGHPDINEREVVIGELRNGRTRVSIAVPVGAENGTVDLEVSLASWLRASGGLGHELAWTTELAIVDEISPRGDGAGRQAGTKGPGEGNRVAFQWRRPDQVEGWTKLTVGSVESVEARMLAQEQSEYQELAALGERTIPVIMLNSEYPPLRKYLDARVRDLVTIETVRDRYAVGTGVGLVLLHDDAGKRSEQGEVIGDAWFAASQAAVARSVLSMMPAFDELAKAAGMDE